jgi:hypothetical protein
MLIGGADGKGKSVQAGNSLALHDTVSIGEGELWGRPDERR